MKWVLIAALLGAWLLSGQPLWAQSRGPARPDKPEPLSRPTTAATSQPAEGAVGPIFFSPPLFSPGFSPGKLDDTQIGFVLSREMPVYLRFSLNGKTVRNVPASAVASQHGIGPDRYVWDGRDDTGKMLGDGQYAVEAFTPVSFNWRYGDPDPRHKNLAIIRHPHAIAVDGERRLYVAGSEWRVMVFDAQGKFIRAIEPKVDGERGISGWIRAMAFSPQGKLLLLLDREIVQMDAADGNAIVLARLSDEKDAKGKVTLKTDWLDGLAIDKKENIYVGCAAAEKVFVFRPDGGASREIGSPGEGDGQFTRLGDIAVGPDGLVYATDHPKSGGRIQIFSLEGKFLRKHLTIYENGPIPMLSPRGIVALGDGSMVVYEGAGGPVDMPGQLKLFARISAKGRLESSWGTSRGSGDGAYRFVSRLIVHGDDIYASDHYDNHRVVRMNGQGAIQQTWQAALGAIVDPTAIVKISPQSYLVIDAALERCTEFATSGQPVRCWSYWAQCGEGAGEMPAGAWADPAARRVWLLLGQRLVMLDDSGKLIERIECKGLSPYAARPPGLHLRGGNPFVTVADLDSWRRMAQAGAGSLISLGKDGALRNSASPREDAYFLGPIVPPDPTDGGLVAVQVMKRSDDGKDRIGVCRLRLADDGGSTIERSDFLGERNRPHVWPQGPFAAGRDKYFKGGSNVAAFNARGEYLWSLGRMEDKDLSPAAMLLDGDSLICVNRKTGHLESWTTNQWVAVAAATVEIDNTPPEVVITGTEAMVRSDEDKLVLRGTAWDKNFDYYTVWYRVVSDDPARPANWTEVREAKSTHAVKGGVLAEWYVNPALRDKGIEVKVVAWDKAGNSNESAPGRLTFDDDGDGMSNQLELTLGTDPRKPTEYAAGDAVQIKTDLAVLLVPYFAAKYEHSLKFSAYDVRDPQNPRELLHPKLTVYADAGSFVGGSVPPATQAATAPATTQATTAPAWSTMVSTQNGEVKWTAPDVAQRTVNFKVLFVEQGLNNVLYKQSTSEFDVEVKKDDDRDWMPDEMEVAPGQDDRTKSLLANADSDGDGVIDGYDICPRQGYGDDEHWSSIYAPGMIQYRQKFMFYGIGGGKSVALKYGDKTSNKNIIYSDRVKSNDDLKGYLNDLLFNRNDKNPLKRKPLEVVRWDSYAPFESEQEEKLGEYKYGDGDYNFIYYAMQSYGVPVIENIQAVDGRYYREAGINRNYLKVSSPGCDEYIDRKVTIQWKITGRDPTTSSEEALNTARMGWQVEVFNSPDLKGADRLFTGFAMGASTGDRIYEATLDVPGENIFRTGPIYLKLTPCWVGRNGRLKPCPWCKTKQEGQYDKCGMCGCGMDRYGFTAVDRAQVAVSGVIVQTPSEVVRWIQRMKPRAGQPMDAEAFDQVTMLVADAVETNSGNWPLNDAITSANVAQDGKSYKVAVCSIRGMTRRPKPDIKRSERETYIRDRAAALSQQLASSDVVCVIANDQRALSKLCAAVAWGTDGTWCEYTGGSGGGAATALPAQATTSPATTPAQPEADLSALSQAWETGKGIVTLGKEAYSVYDHLSDWKKDQAVRSLVAGDKYKFKETKYQIGLDPVTGGLLRAQRSITVQKRYDGLWYVQSRAVVKRPWTIWTDPKTGITITDKSRPQTLILQRTEKVSKLEDSKIIERGCEVQGTAQYQAKTLLARLDKVKTVVKVGMPLVTNGLKVYQCIDNGDYVGVAVFSAKGAVEVTAAVAEVRKAKGVMVEGINISKTAGGKVSVVAIAAGALEASYNIYLYTKAGNPIDKNIALNNTIAAAFDTGIGAIEPYGALILVSWTAGAALGNFISDRLGMDKSPIADEVMSSPGQALVFLPLHFLPESVPPAFAKDAARYAMKDATKNVEKYNQVWNRKYTYIWVPPKKE